MPDALLRRRYSRDDAVRSKILFLPHAHPPSNTHTHTLSLMHAGLGGRRSGGEVQRGLTMVAPVCFAYNIYIYDYYYICAQQRARVYIIFPYFHLICKYIIIYIYYLCARACSTYAVRRDLICIRSLLKT